MYINKIVISKFLRCISTIICTIDKIPKNFPVAGTQRAKKFLSQQFTKTAVRFSFVRDNMLFVINFNYFVDPLQIF